MAHENERLPSPVVAIERMSHRSENQLNSLFSLGRCNLNETDYILEVLDRLGFHYLRLRLNSELENMDVIGAFL